MRPRRVRSRSRGRPSVASICVARFITASPSAHVGRDYARRGSRQGQGRIKLDDVSKGYDRRAFLRLMGLGASAAALAACGGGAGTAVAPPAPATAAPATAAPTVAKPTGNITIYSALNSSTNDQFTAALKAADPGTTTDVLALAAAGDVQTRIPAEKASPKADIFIGGSSEFHDPLRNGGLRAQDVAPDAALGVR